VDAIFMALEFFLGGYVSADIGTKTRIYAGAGPLLLGGLYDSDVEETDPSTLEAVDDSNTDLALGAGLYARAGLEYAVSKTSTLGLSVRAINANLDFGSSAGEIDLDGFQFMVTFGIRF
jgi:hypothetical protein